MSTFFLLLWLGGFIPAYRYAQINGYGWLSSVLNGFCWPCDVGWHLAMKYCKDDKH